MNRPIGVTVLGVLAALGGAFTLALGLLFLLGSDFLARWTGMPHFIASIATLAAASLLTIGAFDLVISFGLFSLANWARILTMIGAALGLAGTAFGMTRALARADLFPLPRQVLVSVVDILIIWYLSRPHVKAAFSPAPRASEPPEASGTPAASA